MFSSGLRKALAIARNTSSSGGNVDHSAEDSGASFVSEEGVLSSGGNKSRESSTVDLASEKLLPGLPVQSTEDSSSTLPEGVHQFTYTKTTVTVDADQPSPLEGETKEATKNPNSTPLRARRSNAAFHPFLHSLAVISVTETNSDTNPLSLTQPVNTPDNPSNTTPVVVTPPKSTSASSPTSSSPSEADEQDKSRRRKRPPTTFSLLQPIVESGGNANLVPPQPKPSASSFAPSILGLDSSFARKMEETGRLRRLQSQSNIKTSPTSTTSPVVPPPPVKSPTSPAKPQNGNAHLKAHSEGDLLPRPAPKSPSPPPLAPVNNLTDVVESQSEDQAALQNLLDKTLLELKAAKEETTRFKAQSDREKSRLVQQLDASYEEGRALQKEKQSQHAKIYSLESQLKKTEKEFKEVMQEKQGWQEQLDTMHHRLTQAERRVRSLDQLTRSKLEARQEGVYGPTKRSQKAPQVREPSMEVIGAVGALNEEILQTANLLVENLERTKTLGATDDVARAKAVLGNKATSMMQTQANDHSKGFRFLLMQVVLEVFMVHWSTNIIEAWYPLQKSFADLLIEMSSKTTVSASVQGVQRVDCGKVKILQTDSNTTVTVKFPEWVADVIKDLTRILSVAGLRIRPNRSTLFTTKLLTLVKIAYDVRTALAEKDICGDLELSVVGPDMPFQAKWMDEAHAMSRKNLLTTMQMEPIVGTSGMGLQRSTTKPNANPIVVLKPKVVLARVLDESP